MTTPASPETNLAPSPAAPGPIPARDKLAGLLIPGETLEALACQRRLFALTHRRIVVAATSSRILIFARGLLGGFRLLDVQWQDLRDAHLREGIFGSDLLFASAGSHAQQMGPGGRMSVTGLRKAEAQAVYVICQAQEQAWREKNRIRELEEMRAKAGGIQVGIPGHGQAAAAAGDGSGHGPGPAAAGQDPAERLRRAKTMLDQGLITDSEYEAIKAKVFAGM